jgi:hypothetical protein
MPFTEFFMNVVPGYNKFRAVSMTLVIAEFCIPLLGFLALHAVVSGKVAASEAVKGLKYAAMVTGGILMVFIMVPGLAGSFLSPFEMGGQLPSWLSDAMMADRRELLRGDAFRSLLFALGGGALIYFFVRAKFGIKVLVPALILLLLLDMWPVSKRYLTNEKYVAANQFTKSFASTRADGIILSDTSEHRVLNLSVSTFNDASTSYWHQSVGGYHGAKMKRYQELIDSVMKYELEGFIQTMQGAMSESDFEPALQKLTSLNMLNTKYIIYNPEAGPLVNRFAMGNAWFADTVIFVANSNEELKRIPQLEGRGALAIERFRENVRTSALPLTEGDKIELVSYKANELIYRSSSVADRVAIFSEIYYPAGWEAWIDGAEVDHFRANYILRALSVPAGEHEIRFVFNPASYHTGNKVSLAGSLLLLLVTVGFIAHTGMKNRKAQA